MELFAKHEETLKRALSAIKAREYWNAFPESLRSYAPEAPQAGERQFQERLERPFAIEQPADGFTKGQESSPYGVDLGITYPHANVETLLVAGSNAQEDWARAGVEDRIGICMGLLDRLHDRTFEIAHAVMYTTGQPFLMAFQTGGPLALDRALETVALAYAAMRKVPAKPVEWVRSEGRNDPLQLDKQWRIRPRGVAVSFTSATAPTWSGYPGIMASLATGNAVIVKPHPRTILPMAIVVATAREVIAEAGFDPDTVQLAVDPPDEASASLLATDPRVKLIDYDGDSSFAAWLRSHATQAQIYIQQDAVNSVIVDSVADLKGVVRNLVAALTTYSGQMSTAPQNIYLPRTGIPVGDERVTAHEVATAIASAVGSSLADDQRAGDILGAIEDPETDARIHEAAANGTVLLPSRRVSHRSFPHAVVRTPVIVQVDAADRNTYLRKMSGPIAYIVTTDGTDQSLQLARESALQIGA